MNEMSFRRGDVVLVPFLYVSDFKKAKSSPALVIQNDIANQYSPNLILALISSRVPKKAYPFHHLIRKGTKDDEQAGLKRDSIIKSEVIITIPKVSILRKIGTLPAEVMSRVDGCLRVSLSL